MLQTRYAIRLLTVTALTAAWVISTQALAVEENPSPAIKAVQGVWVARDDAAVQARWVVKGDAIKVNINGVEYAGKLILDDAAKPHPALTIDIKEGPGDVKGKAAKGVYKIEGDKLSVNIAHPGNERPIDFNPFGEEIYLFELTKKPDAQ